MSLVEVMVAVTMTTLVITITAGAVALTTNQMGDNASRLDSVMQARVAMDAITRVARTAIMPSQLGCAGCSSAAFIAGDEHSMSFYANVDSDQVLPSSGNTTAGPSRVTYTVSGSVLTETVQRPDLHDVTDYNYTYCTPGTTGCAVRSRVVARDLASNALFVYYDRNGSVITTPLQSDTSRLRAVDSMDVTVQLRVGNRTRTATATTRVTLPNADSLILLEDD